MKIAITGGLGFIGQCITDYLLEAGYNVTVFARSGDPELLKKSFGYIRCDLAVGGEWQDRIGEHDVVINLAGANIFTRWNKKIRDEIYSSRIISTANVVQAMGRKKSRAKLLINASATGFYGMHGDEVITENNGSGDDYLSIVCRDWEKEASKAVSGGARVVILRFGTVMGSRGGAFPLMKKVFSLMAGAKLGSGNQWFPWIHVEDAASIILKAVKDKKMSGPYNCTAPGIVRNREFTAAMAKSCRRPVIVPFIPVFMLKLLLGEFGPFLAGGQRVTPERFLKEKHKFLFPEIGPALEDLVKKG